MVEAIKGAVVNAIDALKQSPLVLSLLLFQFALLGLVAWSAHEIRAADNERFALMIKACQQDQR